MPRDDVRGRLAGLVEREDLPPDARLSLRSAIAELATPLQTDVWVYRIVVGVLGLVIVATVIGGLLLAYAGGGDSSIELPEGIVAIGSAAVGALAGLLAPSPRAE